MVVIDRVNKTALVIDTAFPLTHNLSKSEAEKKRKNENLTLKIENIWKLNNMSTYPLVISADVMVNLSEISRKYNNNNNNNNNVY